MPFSIVCSCMKKILGWNWIGVISLFQKNQTMVALIGFKVWGTPLRVCRGNEQSGGLIPGTQEGRRNFW